VRASVLDVLPRPQAAEQTESFVEQLGAHVWVVRFAEAGELGG
jgi:hypothetical protein